jgi:3-oxoacyl-[acyl-carrier protein] reductase
MHIKNRRALVTGATKGIGLAISAKLAQEGYSLVLVARSDSDLKAAASSFSAKYAVKIYPFAGDLANPSVAEGSVSLASDMLGGLDLLVNCAGSTKSGDFFSLTHEDFVQGFAVKFYGAVNLTRLAWPLLQKADAGHLINIIGMRSRTPHADYALGGPVNSALLNFTKAMADRGLKDNVRVNGVSPGFIESGRVKETIAQISARYSVSLEDAKNILLSDNKINRFGQPEEVAALVSFMDSPACGYLHGSIIDLDGGVTKGL